METVYIIAVDYLHEFSREYDYAKLFRQSTIIHTVMQLCNITVSVTSSECSVFMNY